MIKNLLILGATSLFLLAPAAHLQLVGAESTTMIKQEKVISDSDITKAVKDAIASDMSLSKFNINVTTDKGVVTLSGKVDNALAKSNIESKAKAVVGVNKVINNIEIK